MYNFELPCDVCKSVGLVCNDNCSDNLIRYMQLEKEEKIENCVSDVEWSKYIGKFHNVLLKIGVNTQLDVNYLLNTLNNVVNIN